MKKLWMAALGIFLAVGLTACQGEGAGVRRRLPRKGRLRRRAARCTKM